MMQHDLNDLVTLHDLLKNGTITAQEFNSMKDKILNKSNPGLVSNLFGLTQNTYSFLIHISVLLGFIHVILGILIPLVLWVIRREHYQTIDQHGRNILNWILSFSLYLALCLLIFLPINNFMQVPMSFPYLPSLFTGFFPITILMIINVIFLIIGGFKASNGVLWKYPMSIKFFKTGAPLSGK